MSKVPDQSTINLFKAFGYGKQDICYDKDGTLVLPPKMKTAFGPDKQQCVDVDASFESILGYDLFFEGLSEPGLNQTRLQLLAVKGDRVVVNATPSDAAPLDVRYVSLPKKKVRVAFRHDTVCGLDMQDLLFSQNFASAMSKASLDPAKLICVPVRPHPDVARFKCFSDVGPLVSKLNAEKAPGSPFSVLFGYNFFGGRASSQLDKKFEASITCEPVFVVRDVAGQVVDVSPPLFDETCKLFYEHDSFSAEQYSEFFSAMHSLAGVKILPFSFESLMPRPILDSVYSDSRFLPKLQKLEEESKLRNPEAFSISDKLMLRLYRETSTHFFSIGAVRRPESGYGVKCLHCSTYVTEEEIAPGSYGGHFCGPTCRKYGDEAARLDSLKKKHDLRDEVERSVAAVAAAKRKAKIAAERVARAEAAAEKEAAAAPRKLPCKTTNKKKARSKQLEQLVHEAWASPAERAARVEAFNAKQEEEHLNAVLAKERRKLDDVKRLQKKMEAEAEARLHVVPPKSSLAAFVSVK